ncbi:hypothetical protein [Nocardia sp. NPDC056100]|uniref:hypothetical protein n=1 Tax=Nocardia sp. NPDC056100 TaxID=3345712 RepID=UPI0035DE3B51
MFAGIARAAVGAAIAVPLVALAAPPASADQPAPTVNQPGRTYVDAPYISITICVHIPTPGSATLDWCWP